MNNSTASDFRAQALRIAKTGWKGEHKFVTLGPCIWAVRRADDLTVGIIELRDGTRFDVTSIERKARARTETVQRIAVPVA